MISKLDGLSIELNTFILTKPQKVQDLVGTPIRPKTDRLPHIDRQGIMSSFAMPDVLEERSVAVVPAYTFLASRL
jgi:hypothetical protein